MIILEDILSQEIIQKLGWTLVHFIWQAAVIAILVAILLKVLRKSTANLRYIFACLALGLIVLLPVITIQLIPVSVPHLSTHIEPAPAPAVLSIEEMPAAETIIVEEPMQPESVTLVSAVSWKQRAVDTLEPALPYIVSGWLFGVFGLSLWHLGGWSQLQRLKRRMVKQVDDALSSKLKVLAQRLRVKQTVQLMESALVQIPTVVGWLRPVILLPATALTGLTSEQLEAILAHELAHIKRFDYLLNMLQTVVEILGFYHPAVWWVSHKIRAERENCCDDIAVSISGDRVCYARALTSMEEIRAGRGQLAIAATGGNLFKRIRRLVSKDSTEKTSFSWIPAVTVLLLIIALLIPTTLALTAKSNPQKAVPKSNVPIEDKKAESAVKLKRLGLAVAMYADDHDDNLPDSLKELKPYIRDEKDFNWLLDNIKYLGSGKSAQRNAVHIPIAYDKTLLEDADGTNVLSLDFSVRFLDTKEFEKLDIKRAEFLIEARFLSVSEDFLQNIGLNTNSPDEAKALFKLKSEMLAASDGSKTQSLILDERNVSLLLKAVRAHKDSKVLAAPQVICLEGKSAQIKVVKVIPFFTGYTEPNNPSEKPQPKFDYVEEGITMSLRPKLTQKKYIDMEFELEITQALNFEERMYKGEYPYMHFTVEKTTQATRYIAKNGQTLLCWGHKISKHKDGRTKQKDLLVLIKAQTAGSSEQDKSDQVENVTVSESTRTTSDMIVPPAIAKSRIERRSADEQEKTKSETKLPQTTQIFHLKHNDTPKMVQIVKPLLTNTGHLSTDERTNSLIVSDTAENMKRIELIIKEYDVSKPDETITEIFEIRNGDPVEIVELLKKLINGRPDNGSIIEQGKQPIVLVPEPRRKWIIAKASPENMKQIGEWIEKLDREEPAPASLEQIDQQTIKPHEMQKIRQEYINNDPRVKSLSEKIAKDETELIAARQKFIRSHPEVRKKDLMLQVSKKILDELIKAAGKSFDDTMTKETYKTYKANQEKIAKLLDELREPNLPLAREVPLITSTFIDADLIEVLQYIASMAGIPIIPDETVVGLVTTELQNVPLETALDIVLAGTPYVVKKTPYYYLVASAVEPPEFATRMESAKKLSNLGKALLEYANDYVDKYPDSLHRLTDYLNVEELTWVLANIEYLAHGKHLASRPDTIIAYDKKLLAKGKGTNVLYNDFHVGFEKVEKLKKLGISESEIMIETIFLSVNEDYLKDVGLDVNTENFSDAWTKHLASKYPAGPNGQPYGIIIDDLHVTFLLRAVQAHHGSKALIAPRVITRAGTTAEMRFTTEEYRYIKGYTEPNPPSDKPEPKLDKVEIGTRIWLTPKLTDDNRNVNLDLKLEMRQLKGIIEGKYKGKYPYYKPIVDVISAKMPCTIPKGKTMLIGGLKINEKEKEPRAPRLKDLPLIGAVFSSKDKAKDQKMLLILVKPITNPQQKATKILPGQEDAEEHIKSLTRQLEKKLNSPTVTHY